MFTCPNIHYEIMKLHQGMKTKWETIYVCALTGLLIWKHPWYDAEVLISSQIWFFSKRNVIKRKWVDGHNWDKGFFTNALGMLVNKNLGDFEKKCYLYSVFIFSLFFLYVGYTGETIFKGLYTVCLVFDTFL